MNISNVNKNSIKKISNTELLNLHYRIHQLYTNAKKVNNKKMMIFYNEKHDILVAEMNQRGLKHKSPITMSIIQVKKIYNIKEIKMNIIQESINNWISESSNIKPKKELLLVPKGMKPNNNKNQNCKLRGIPDWIQSNQTPKCKKCNSIMSFIGQLASIQCGIPYNKRPNDDYIFGDCGVYYVFACENCGEDEKVVFQSH